MIELLKTILFTAKSTVKTHRELALENLALRQQLAVLKQSKKRPKLSNTDRCFWIMLSRAWKNWSEALIIVKPETVTRWHRQGFKRLGVEE
jgi:putative transposase